MRSRPLIQNRFRTLRWLVLCCAVGSAFAVMKARSNPYQAIVDRNVFGLKPPPPPVSPDAVQKAPPGKIILQGICSILGRWQVVGKVQVPAKPPEPAKEVPFILSAGERDGEVEVVSIDGNSGTIKFVNAGVEQVMTMDKDAAKPTASGPPGGTVPPGVVPRPPGAIPPPPGAALRTIPTRAVRSGGDNPQMQGGQQPDSVGGAGVGGVGGVPPGETQPTMEPQEYTPVQNAARYELNRLKNDELRQEGIMIPRLPRHPAMRDIPEDPPEQPVSY